MALKAQSKREMALKQKEVKWIFITQLLPLVMEYRKGYKLWFLSQDRGQWPLKASIQYGEAHKSNTHHTKAPTAAQQ